MAATARQAERRSFMGKDIKHNVSKPIISQATRFGLSQQRG